MLIQILFAGDKHLLLLRKKFAFHCDIVLVLFTYKYNMSYIYSLILISGYRARTGTKTKTFTALATVNWYTMFKSQQKPISDISV